jgi:hypothetical protein
MVCRTEDHGLLLMRTRPGSTTVKASRSREPNLDTASITVADLARRARAVLCEHPLLFQRTFQHLVIGRTPRNFGDGNHVVTRFAQRLDYSLAQLSSATKFMR